MKRLVPVLLLVLSCLPGSEPEDVPTGAHVDLAAAEHKVYSQFGEDGVIEKIFEIVPPTSHYAVEFGAYDGVTNSNTRNLIEKHGWGGLQIEGNPRRARKLMELYADNPKVTALQAWVFPGNIEILFEEAGVPEDLDLLVIDIDSNDYYVWRAIHDYRPKVVQIEYNHAFPPPRLAVIDFHPMNYWDHTNYHGASLQSLYKLARQKGYELVHVMSWGPNAFFVDARYYDRFGIEDNSPSALWPPQPPVESTIDYPPGKRTLHVKAFDIEKRWILDR